MEKKQNIIFFYIGIGLFAVAILAVSMWLRRQGKEVGDKALATQVVRIDKINTIENPITLKDQNGEPFDLNQLRGKIWTLNAFFASCPQCVENYSDHLVRIHKHYLEHPDFRMVSISVDPRETPQRIKENLSRLDIDFSKWTFLMGDQKEVRRFLEKEVGFAETKNREGQEAVEKGAFAHDMGLMVVDKDMNIRLKQDLFIAAELMPETLEPRREAIIETIGALLAGKNERPRGKAEIEFQRSSPIQVRTGAPIEP